MLNWNPLCKCNIYETRNYSARISNKQRNSTSSLFIITLNVCVLLLKTYSLNKINIQNYKKTRVTTTPLYVQLPETTPRAGLCEHALVNSNVFIIK